MRSIISILAIPAVLALPGPSAAQLGSALAKTVPYKVAPVPFGPGEVMRYDVKWGIFGSVGEGRLEVVGVDSMHGHPSYHLAFAIAGGLPLAKVNDLNQSWLDVTTLQSHRFDQNTHEVNYKRHRIIDFFPKRNEWVRLNSDEKGELASAEPLDDVSFLYFVRTLPLEVGKTYTFNRYWKNEGNPVTVNVLRKDSIKIGEDTYNTIVVQPIIKTRGIFSEGGEAEVHFSDDERRLIVHLRAKMSIGTLRMYLQSYTPGQQLISSVDSTLGDSR